MSYTDELKANILNAIAAGVPVARARSHYRKADGGMVPDRTIRGWIADHELNKGRGSQYDSILADLDAKNPVGKTMSQIAQSARDVLHQKSAVAEFAPPPPPPAVSPEPEGIRIIVIGDMQVKPDIDLDYCRWIGEYVAHKRPDVIVNIGDFADMPSLSFHDEPGSMGYEGQRYKRDILSVHEGMKRLMGPINEAMKTGWKPRLVMTLGNHEHRIDRTISATPKLDGMMGLPDLEYERWGWEVHPFLQPVVIEGVVFCHYFCSGPMGRAIGLSRTLLTKLHMSAVAGHQQGRCVAMGKRADGKMMTAIIAGSCYIHEEKYLNPQTNNHWRGLYLLNDVRDGEFEEVAISMRYLQREYGTPVV